MNHAQVIAFVRTIATGVNTSGQFMYAKENVASVETYNGPSH